MDFHGISQMVSVNVMDHRRMMEARLARLRRDQPSADVAMARAGLQDEMRRRVRTFNRWICDAGAARPRLIPFVMADPVLFGDALLDEVEQCIARGARGVKIHPGICGHAPDHPAMLPLYDRLQELDLPALTDSGGEERDGVPPFGEPLAWAPVLRQFPHLRLIMAHFAGEYWDERVELAREFPGGNLVFDISGGLVDSEHPPRGHRELLVTQAVRVFRTVGIDRLLFGSDGPGLDPMDTARQVVALDLTDGEKERIFSRNARAFLGLGRPATAVAAAGGP